MTTPYRAPGLGCPHCPGASLREFQRRYVCDECQGILIPFDDLMSAAEDVAGAVQKLAYRDERATETPCPVCLRAMTACKVAMIGDDRTHKLGAEFLRCDRDGLWFPTGALAEMLAKVSRRISSAGVPTAPGSVGLDGLPNRRIGAATGGLRISQWHERGRRRAPTLTPVNAYADRRLACPVCPQGGAGLIFQGDRWVCATCLGAFLQNAALIGLITEMTEAPWEMPAPTGVPGPRACPVCTEPMTVERAGMTHDVEPGSTGSSIEIDRCVAHGVWFDAGELGTALEHAGGLHQRGLGAWIKQLFFS